MPAVDLAGNTLGTARGLNITPNSQTFTDHVSPLDPNDYYRFSLTGRSSFSLSVNGLSADADVQLLNGSGQTIQSSANVGATAEAINATLNSGTYYIRVFPFNSASTNYNLNVSAALVDYAGNAIATARDIGTISNTQQVLRDSVTSFDTNDYYRFTVDPTSSLSIRLDGLSADADVELLRSNGKLVAFSNQEGTGIEQINTSNLAPGTYYIRVSQFSGNTNYNLTVAATPPDFAGNTLTTARNLGALNGTRTVQDAINTSDTNDYYRFNVGPNSNLSLRLDGLSADANLQLLNINGQVVANSFLTGTSAETINFNNLTAGAYYVRVYQGSGNSFYNLSLSATVPDFVGNTFTTARNMGSLNGSRTFSDFVNSADPNDYYRFNLNAGGNFSLSLNGLSADADVQLYNSIGQVIATSAQVGTTAESINTFLGAGTYYVRVNSFNNVSTYYNLSLSSTQFTTLDNAGNTLPTARDIGTLSNTQQVFRDAVNSLDTNDYYRFTVDPTSNLNITLNGLSADADVQLINSANQVLLSSVNDGVLAESINTSNLAPGTYYIRVYQFSGNTNYNLSVSATPPDFAGNALTTARDIGPLNGTRTFQDAINTSDTNDYYRFNVGPNSNLSLRLDGLSADANLQLLNINGQVVANSFLTGTSAETINFNNLTPGAYYVRVYQGSGGGFYNLTASATIPDFAGSTFATARNIGQLNGSRTLGEWVSSADVNDYFRFDLAEGRSFGLSLNGLSADANLQLYNINGLLISSSSQVGTVADSINTFLGAGTYYVRVNSFNNASSFYNLSLLV